MLWATRCTCRYQGNNGKLMAVLVEPDSQPCEAEGAQNIT